MANPAHLPISDLFQLKTVCEDCGRRAVYSRHEVAREQLRRGLATPEEVASYYACEHCRARGGDGKNISVRLVSRSGVSTAVERDLRPLASLSSVHGECLNCGHSVQFDQEQLSEYPAALTVHDLWVRAVCGVCKGAGARHARMAIDVFTPMEKPQQPAPKIEWSRAEVFGEDRSDPFAALPRRRMFGGQVEVN